MRKVDPISLAVGDESANPRFVFGSDDGYDGLAELDRPRNLLSTHLPGEVQSRLRAGDDSDERLAVAHPGAHCCHVTLIHLDVEPARLLSLCKPFVYFGREQLCGRVALRVLEERERPGRCCIDGRETYFCPHFAIDALGKCI